MITVYSKDDCPQCEKVKMFLRNNEIAFDEIDVIKDEDALKYIKGKGYSQLPVTEVEGQADIKGFDLNRLYALL